MSDHGIKLGTWRAGSSSSLDFAIAPVQRDRATRTDPPLDVEARK